MLSSHYERSAARHLNSPKAAGPSVPLIAFCSRGVWLCLFFVAVAAGVFAAPDLPLREGLALGAIATLAASALLSTQFLALSRGPLHPERGWVGSPHPVPSSLSSVSAGASPTEPKVCLFDSSGRGHLF